MWSFPTGGFNQKYQGEEITYLILWKISIWHTHSRWGQWLSLEHKASVFLGMFKPGRSPPMSRSFLSCRIMFIYVKFVPQMYRNQLWWYGGFDDLIHLFSWAQTKVSQCRKPRLQMATFSRDDHHGPLLYLRPPIWVCAQSCWKKKLTNLWYLWYKNCNVSREGVTQILIIDAGDLYVCCNDAI